MRGKVYRDILEQTPDTVFFADREGIEPVADMLFGHAATRPPRLSGSPST